MHDNQTTGGIMKCLMFAVLMLIGAVCFADSSKVIKYTGQSSNSITLKASITETELYNVPYESTCSTGQYTSWSGTEDCGPCTSFMGGYCPLSCEAITYSCTDYKTETNTYSIGQATAKVNISYDNLGSELKGKDLSFAFSPDSESVYLESLSLKMSDFLITTLKKNSESNIGKNDKEYSFSLQVKRKSAQSFKNLVTQGLRNVEADKQGKYLVVYLPKSVSASDFSYIVNILESKAFSNKELLSKKVSASNFSISKTTNGEVLSLDLAKFAAKNNVTLKSGKKYKVEFMVRGLSFEAVNLYAIFNSLKTKEHNPLSFFAKTKSSVKIKYQ